jgi:hypothetical protein
VRGAVDRSIDRWCLTSYAETAVQTWTVPGTTSALALDGACVYSLQAPGYGRAGAISVLDSRASEPVLVLDLGACVRVAVAAACLMIWAHAESEKVGGMFLSRESQTVWALGPDMRGYDMRAGAYPPPGPRCLWSNGLTTS